MMPNKQRLKEKLSVLAISVMNQWPNVRLRVIEGWDEDMRHAPNSLHYEGRAVDITTSDKDKSKYGMLARLAVEAGFDWVHYESRSHVHCSVKSEKADTIRNNGCFDARSLVETPLGQVEMSQLQTNDLVLAMNPKSGELKFSPVILWLDRDELGSELYVELTTKSGQLIRLTSSHLIYTADELPPAALEATATATAAAAAAPATNQTASVAHDLSSKRTGGNNYTQYYYEYTGAGAAAPLNGLPNAPANSTTTRTTASESGTAPASTETITPPAARRDTFLADDLREFVYTDYARHVLVGQYVLTSGVADQQLELVAPDGGLGRPELESGRLILPRARGSSSVAAEKEAKFHIRRKKARQQHWKQQAPVPSVRMPHIKYDQIVSVNFVQREGIYAPLTREGNIVVNSVLASCYAIISDQDMAHLSFAPLRWINILQEHTIGLRPDVPLSERLIESVQRRNEMQAILGRSQSHSMAPDYSTTNGLNRTTKLREDPAPGTKSTRYIHWYAVLLYNIARLILPNSYLY